MRRLRFARRALPAAAVLLLAACTEDQPAPLLVHTYAMGDRINIGHLVYQVFEALGAEAGTRATVQVDPQHHQVQVIHHV